MRKRTTEKDLLDMLSTLNDVSQRRYVLIWSNGLTHLCDEYTRTSLAVGTKREVYNALDAMLSYNFNEDVLLPKMFDPVAIARDIIDTDSDTVDLYYYPETFAENTGYTLAEVEAIGAAYEEVTK